MIKILAACGAGVNSSHQIKSALEEELSNRGYDVHCDAVMVKDVNEDLMKGYDIFTPIAATDLGFEPGIPVIEAGILFENLFKPRQRRLTVCMVTDFVSLIYNLKTVF
ncbi:PTS sugar transporter subunit IIB [Streptococcus pneumoniae]|uniref:PTS sugar transporter subunit IIB n=1 Tax=Streptococcus pneumoniae TaxID=1313 RepID=UPI00061B9957|nr:PTS sugar transporter subunit IIB [Streptococcus pneumoniae]COR81007.1 PTS system galactose-specific transporter subunit IIB [Streptococcus pneumoniae]